MHKKQQIKQDDSWRVSLTEIAPFEAPLKFSFENLYAMEGSENISTLTRGLLFGSVAPDRPPSSFVPYTYTIQKGAGETRELGIIHPHLLKELVSFYSDYEDLILVLCSKSNWSLRRPVQVAKMYTPKFVFTENLSSPTATATATDTHAPEEAAVYQKNASSYFAYSPHNFLYKFFESRALLEAERKFKFCRKLDIAKCFANIYTHSISWAVKTKPHAKKEIDSKHTFDAVFDSIMRRANDGETHGILVGAEVSRIFAEIILQQVDVDVSTECNKSLIDGKHYTLRRYVDDYFLFYNDEVSMSMVQQALENSLKKYKLYLNDFKASTLQRPFLTDLSVCKSELRQRIAQYFRDAVGIELPSNELGLFTKLRSIIRNHGIEYSSCSAYILSQLFAQLLSLLKDRKIEDLSEIQEFLVCEILQVGFSLFSIDPRFRTSFLLGKMIIFLSRRFSISHSLRGCGISDALSFEVRRLLEGFIGRSMNMKLEICTLLLTLKEVPNVHPLPLQLIEDTCFPDIKHSELNYFLIVTLLDLLGCSPVYGELKFKLKALALAKIRQSTMPIRDCEIFMLTIDLIASPLLDDGVRRELIAKLFEAFYKKTATADEINLILGDLKRGSIFYEWSTDFTMSSFIAKKELAFTY